jgi:trigger factor
LKLSQLQKKIAVSDEEVDAELEKYAPSYQKSTAELRELFASNGSLEGLSNDLVIRKTVDFLLQNSKHVSAAV